MFRHVKLGIATLVRLFRSGQSLLLENLALRQQLTVLKRRNPRPTPGTSTDFFWIVARRSGWKQSLILVSVVVLGESGGGSKIDARSQEYYRSYRIQFCAKSFILQMHNLLTRHNRERRGREWPILAICAKGHRLRS